MSNNENNSSFECQKLTNLIDKYIYNNKIVLITEKQVKTCSDIEKAHNIFVNQYKENNIIRLSINHVLIDLSLRQSYSDIKDIVDICLYKRYGSKNNYKQIGRNTNSYYNLNPCFYVLYPLVFINGMNIGTLQDLKKLNYREELDILL